MSELPDVCTELQGDNVVVVANKKARRVLNKYFAKPRPRWNAISEGSGCFRSLEYRALQLEGNCEPALAAMLWTAHDAGLSAMFMCASCSELHVVDDEQAKRLRAIAIEGSVQAHETLQ